MQARPNKNRRGRQSEKYIYVPYLNESNYVTKLLLTEKEFLNAKSRAEKNPEDTFGDVIAFQVLENKVCNKITDVKKENFE
jgi:hypothetical protein